MPARAEAALHQQQDGKEKVVAPHEFAREQRIDVRQLLVGQVPDMRRKARGQGRERIARFEDGEHVAEFFERVRDADPSGQPAERPHVALKRGERRRDASPDLVRE